MSNGEERVRAIPGTAETYTAGFLEAAHGARAF